MTSPNVLLYHRARRAFTLIEVLVVIGIIALLSSGLVFVGQKVTERNRERATLSTMQVLNSALGAYKNATDRHDGNFNFPTENYAQAALVNDIVNAQNPAYLEDALSAQFPTAYWDSGYISNTHTEPWKIPWTVLDPDQSKIVAARSSIEVLHTALKLVPACQEVLSHIADKDLTNVDADGISLDGNDGVYEIPLFEVNDAWGMPLRYRNRGQGNFPEITSAGPDNLFDTEDDLRSSDLN